MKLEDLPDDFTPLEFRYLDREGLDKVPYERKRWLCQAKGCTGGTHVRDYGLSPCWLDRGSKRSREKPKEYWKNLSRTFWMCGRHYKIYKRLHLRFGHDHTYRRLMDEASPLTKIVDIIKPQYNGHKP